MVVVRVAPFVMAVRPPGIEAIIICPVGIAAILAVKIIGQRGANRTADNHTCNRRAGTSAAGSVPEKPADQPTGDNAGGIW